MCSAYQASPRSTRNDETPVKHQRSLSASDAIKKVIPPERQLNLPELTSKESLSVQTETVRLNGQNTINLVETPLAMTTNLIAEVTQLKTDNAVLRFQISELQSCAMWKQQLGVCPPNQEPWHTKTP